MPRSLRLSSLALEKLVKEYHRAFKFKEFDLQLVMADGDFVSWRTVTAGTQVGEFYGVPATATNINVITHAFVRFDENHRAKEAWVLTDYLSMITDLFFGMSWWQRIIYFPRIWGAVKKHLALLGKTTEPDARPQGS